MLKIGFLPNTAARCLKRLALNICILFLGILKLKIRWNRAATWTKFLSRYLKAHKKCLNRTIKCQKVAKFAHRLWANFGTLQSTLKNHLIKKNAKNCPEKEEKGGKIIFMDFTARLKSCSTKTKFHNFFKSYRKVA